MAVYRAPSPAAARSRSRSPERKRRSKSPSPRARSRSHSRSRSHKKKRSDRRKRSRSPSSESTRSKKRSRRGVHHRSSSSPSSSSSSSSESEDSRDAYEGTDLFSKDGLKEAKSALRSIELAKFEDCKKVFEDSRLQHSRVGSRSTSSATQKSLIAQATKKLDEPVPDARTLRDELKPAAAELRTLVDSRIRVYAGMLKETSGKPLKDIDFDEVLSALRLIKSLSFQIVAAQKKIEGKEKAAKDFSLASADFNSAGLFGKDIKAVEKKSAAVESAVAPKAPLKPVKSPTASPSYLLSAPSPPPPPPSVAHFLLGPRGSLAPVSIASPVSRKSTTRRTPLALSSAPPANPATARLEDVVALRPVGATTTAAAIKPPQSL